MNVEEIAEILTKAKKAVDEAGIEGDLKVVAFRSAINMQLGIAHASGKLLVQNPQSNIGLSEQGGDVESSLGKIARKLNLAPELVERVFYVDDEEGLLQVVVSTKLLGKTLAEAIRTITLLTAAGRQAAGLDERITDVEVIKDECKRIGKMDPSNFAARVASTKDMGVAITGSGQKRQIRITATAYEKAKELITNMLSVSDSK